MTGGWPRNQSHNTPQMAYAARGAEFDAITAAMLVNRSFRLAVGGADPSGCFVAGLDRRATARP